MEREANTEMIEFYILVPVYKVEKYIKKCIESVLYQTYHFFKLILVDDGSPDNSGKICDEYAKKDERIVVIHQKNMGPLASRQVGEKYVREQQVLEQKIGRYNQKSTKKIFIIYLDSDDSLKKNALEKIYKIIQKYACDMVIYGFELVKDGKTICPYNKKINFSGILENKRLLYNLVFNNSGYNSLCRKAISLSLYSGIDYSKYYYIFSGEDLLESIAFYKACKRVYFLDESLYNYTINLESTTHTVFNKNFHIDFTVRQHVFEFLLAENLFTLEDWKQYRSYCIRLLIEIIWGIINIKINSSNKINYFKEIYKSEYFQNYIYKKEYNKNDLGLLRIIYILFEKKMFRMVLFVGFLFWALKIFKGYCYEKINRYKRKKSNS